MRWTNIRTKLEKMLAVTAGTAGTGKIETEVPGNHLEEFIRIVQGIIQIDILQSKDQKHLVAADTVTTKSFTNPTRISQHKIQKGNSRSCLLEPVNGPCTQAHLARNITTIARQRYLNGKNQRNGLKRKHWRKQLEENYRHLVLKPTLRLHPLRTEAMTSIPLSPDHNQANNNSSSTINSHSLTELRIGHPLRPHLTSLILEGNHIETRRSVVVVVVTASHLGRLAPQKIVVPITIHPRRDR